MDTLPRRTWKERNFRPQLINPAFLCHSGGKEGGGGRGGRGAVDSEVLVGGVWLGSPNSDPISVQSIPILLTVSHTYVAYIEK